MSNSSDLQQLEWVCRRIHACRACARVVPSIVPRKILPSVSGSSLVLMAQAPSEHGVRVSGVHWVDAAGRLRPPGGAYLEKYLRRVGYSIDSRETKLPRPHTTNVVQCWPGSAGKRDRAPSKSEILACSQWWKQELRILKPRAMVLLGKPAADAFALACELDTTFRSMLDHQGMSLSFESLALHCYTVPHPAAPYRGGRDVHYERAFAGVGELLATPWWS